MRFCDERLLEDPACDTRLVGHDDDGEIRAVQRADRVDAVGKEHQAFETIEVPGLFDQRAVAIKEYCGTRSHHCSRARGATPSRAATISNTSSDVMRFMH